VYTVRHAAALTGIPAATLRIWERRYAVVTPTRTESGYRVYDDLALQRLSAMAALVAAGWAPRQAAEHVKAGRSAAPSSGSPQDPVESGSVTSAGLAADPPAAWGDTAVLTRLAIDLDAPALDALLDDVFARGSFEEVVEGWVFPALHQLGLAWHDGSVSVAGEHFVSATVQRRIANAFESARVAEGAPRVLVGLARGSRHELGVLAFATALRRAGLDVVYVGGDLPPESWAQSVARLRPAAVVIGVPASDDVLAVRDTVAVLTAAAPDLPVHLGGRHQDRVGGVATPLGHALATAAADLARRLTGEQVSRGSR